MALTEIQLVDDTLDRLGDLDTDIWSREEIGLYLQDGLDQFTRRTECLFDIFVIENTPHAGNWQTHFERYMASRMPGSGVSDEPMNWTGGDTRNMGTEGRVGGAYQGPAAITKVPEGRFLGEAGAGEDVPRTVYGGRLPDSTVKILRVTYDYMTLVGVGSQQMRKMDATYETRTGDPQWFVYDKDGLFFVRVVPAATGNAPYPEVSGGYGSIVSIVEETFESPESLTHYWTLDNLTTGLTDQIGSNNLTVIGGSPTLVAGKHNGGLSTSGANALFTASNITRSGGARYSVSLWWKPAVTPPFGDQVFGIGAGNPALYYDDDTSTLTVQLQGVFPTVTVPVDGEFHHLVLTYDSGTHTVQLYVDGLLEIEATDTIPSESDEQLYINGPFQFDEVADFDDILTPSQVADLYYGGVGRFYPDLMVSETLVTAESETDGYGILRLVEGGDDHYFPSGGPWGTPTRIHPQTANIYVEVVRTARPLHIYPSELPDAYNKYVVYYAMGRALKRAGPGHDEKLGDHYLSRFEMGVEQMKAKRQAFNSERVGRFGGQPAGELFGMGLPQPPTGWGIPRR